MSRSEKEATAIVISQTAEYALRAMAHLARGGDRPWTNQEIAEATQVPPGYLAKVMQGLARAGLIASRRGIRGGFVLSRDPSEITLYEVLQAVDPIRRITACPLGLDEHSEELCPLHQRLDEAYAFVEKTFRETTLADVAE
ncbi:MAG: Rrf2 family transcriptional regulator [Fimbriimonadales bacterium]